MGSTAWRRLRLAVTFAHAALHYWLTVFPLVHRETRRWAKRAAEIPDPVLRRIALETQRGERGNYEGAGAFASFVPLRRRATVVRAVVAFQLAFDFADSLVEQPAADRIANGRALHESLHAALSPGGLPRSLLPASGSARRRRVPGRARGRLPPGRSCCSLPGRWSPARHARWRDLLSEFQVGNHADEPQIAGHLAAFALRVPDRGAALRWWEAAAAGGFIAGGVRTHRRRRPPATDRRTRPTRSAAPYLPWIGALHILLDSLVDWPRDVPAGHHSLVAHYASRSEMASGMGAIADAAVRAARRLPRARQHELLLVAMAGLYLARPAASLPHARETRARILSALGELAWPVLLVHRARGQLGFAASRN